jgi:hypothetical protein
MDPPLLTDLYDFFGSFDLVAIYHSRCEVGTQQDVAPGYRYPIKAVASRAVEQRTETGIQRPPNLTFVHTVKRNGAPVRGTLRGIRLGVLE